MNALSLPQLDRLRSYAPLVLRIALGVIMAAHGWSKLNGGPANFGNGMLAQAGIPAPVLFGWIVTLVELVGGLLLIVGLFTRLCALLIGAVMIVAILTVKAKMGLIVPGAAGAELDLAILAGVLALAFIGAGPLSLDRQLQLEGVPAS